jgi:hypothetical protein
MSGRTKMAAIGTTQAVVAMANGPAPMTDKTAVMMGKPKMTT